MPLNTFANRTSSLPLSELDANFTFVSDSTNLSFLQSGTGAVSRTVQAKERDIVSVKDFGAVGDGSTDDTAAIQAAIDAANTAGYGTVVIPSSCAIGSKLVLKRNVSLCFSGGAKLIWIGSASGTCVETLDSDVVQNCNWTGLTIDTGAAFTGTALAIHSIHNINADVIRFISTGTTSKCMTIYANSSGGESSTTKRNVTAFNVGLIVQQGECGTLMEFGGVDVASGYDGNAQVVTLNDFKNGFAEKCWVYGINIIDWTDNNTFSGMWRVASYGNNAIGLACPSGTSGANNLGVYSNVFNLFAADTFSTYTGRVGAYFGRGKLNEIKQLYNNPVAEGGAFVSDTTALSFDVNYGVDSTALFLPNRRLTNPAFLAKITGAQTFTGAKTKVDMTSEVYDTHSAFDAAASTFTAPVAGIYDFFLVLNNTTGVTLGDVWLFTIEATGSSTQVFRTIRYVIADSNGGAPVELGAQISLAAGDVVTCYCTRSSGTGNYVEIGDATFNYLSGKLVG